MNLCTGLPQWMDSSLCPRGAAPRSPPSRRRSSGAGLCRASSPSAAGLSAPRSHDASGPPAGTAPPKGQTSRRSLRVVNGKTSLRDGRLEPRELLQHARQQAGGPRRLPSGTRRRGVSTSPPRRDVCSRRRSRRAGLSLCLRHGDLWTPIPPTETSDQILLKFYSNSAG